MLSQAKISFGKLKTIATSKFASLLIWFFIAILTLTSTSSSSPSVLPNNKHKTSNLLPLRQSQQLVSNQKTVNYFNGMPSSNTNLNTNSNTTTTHQKVRLFQSVARDKEFLTHDVIESACRKDRGCQRRDRLNNTYLYYCTRHRIDNLLSNELLMSLMHNSENECITILDEFIQMDDNIHKYDEIFTNLIRRYNSPKEYSVKWGIKDCTKAYLDWLCTINLPYYMHGERVKPCISFCERVEQRCPYLHPITKEQYGGQPVFICRDPNIPLFVPSLGLNIPYSEPTKCYDLCHLNASEEELEKDSLSKYSEGKCPDQGLLAVQACMDS